jgi:hypothetical protein
MYIYTIEIIVVHVYKSRNIAKSNNIILRHSVFVNWMSSSSSKTTTSNNNNEQHLFSVCEVKNQNKFCAILSRKYHNIHY